MIEGRLKAVPYKNYLAVSINWGITFVDILVLRALLFGVCIIGALILMETPQPRKGPKDLLWTLRFHMFLLAGLFNYLPPMEIQAEAVILWFSQLVGLRNQLRIIRFGAHLVWQASTQI